MVKNYQFRIIHIVVFIALALVGALSNTASAQRTTMGAVPPPGTDRGLRPDKSGQVVIDGVPAYLWHHGCGPTAIGMIIGYYDSHGAPDLIPGDATTQTPAVDVMIGTDSQSPWCEVNMSDHFHDYACPIDDFGTIQPDRSETGGAHADNCIADFMLTSRSSEGNQYGWSWWDDIGNAFIQYVAVAEPNLRPEEFDYVFSNFSWSDYKDEIDNSRPVGIIVDTDGDGETDHFVTGIGYNDEAQEFGIHDTWDDNIHWYDWSEIAPGNQWGILGVTVFRNVIWTSAFYIMDSTQFVDGNNDGFFDPGENAQVYFFLRNIGIDDPNATVTITSSNSDITFINNTVSYPAAYGDGGTIDNMSIPFEFIIPDIAHPVFDTFFVTIESDSGVYDHSFMMEHEVGHTQILLVDDDRGNTYEKYYYVNDFRLKGMPVHIWDKFKNGSPSGSELAKYNTVVWFTCDSTDDFLQPSDIAAMEYYLDNGGNLFLTGQGLAGELNNEDPIFLNDYLHVQYSGQHFWYEHEGIDASPVGHDFKIRYSGGAQQSIILSQKLTPVNGGTPEFSFSNDLSAYSAVSFSGSYKTVFFSFGYEAIANFASWNTRNEVLTRVLSFLNGWAGPVCGDADGSEDINLLDITYLISYLYDDSMQPPLDMPLSGDANADGSMNLIDILYLINFIYGDPPGPEPKCP